MSEPLICDVAIVGGGPAGIAAAMELRRRGVERVVILERKKAAGGVPRHCGHPPFGMREFRRILTGPAYAGKLCEAALAAGVDIRPQTAVTTLRPFGELDVTTPARPAEIVARRVVLATGGRESPRSARRVSGDRPVGVITTGPCSKASISRASNLSDDLSSSARNWSAFPLSYMPQGRHSSRRRRREWVAADGATPARFVSAPSRDTHALRRRDHRHQGAVAGRGGDRACCGRLAPRYRLRRLLFTGRFVPEAALVGSALRLDAVSGGPDRPVRRCSDPSYFAAGNLLRPIETAGWSYCEGRCIGGFVADDLEGRLIAATPSAAIERGPGVSCCARAVCLAFAQSGPATCNSGRRRRRPAC